jgi:hypothetical protein
MRKYERGEPFKYCLAQQDLYMHQEIEKQLHMKPAEDYHVFFYNEAVI